MSKLQAIVLTVLLVIALIVLLVASFFVKSYYGFSLYQLIIGAIGYMWIGEGVEKFYKCLTK